MQPESYRHDYTAVEQRLRQLETRAHFERMMSLGILILAMAVAACALILCAAYAWRLATPPEQIERVVEPAVTPVVPDAVAVPPNAPEAAGDEPGVVTTNFTLFREKRVEIGNRPYAVTAGHKYLTETDTIFADAWCYTRQIIDGVDIQINLGNLEPGSVPVRRPVSSQTLAQTGLTQANLSTLFESCPWLSGNPNVQEAVPPSSVSPGI